MMVMVLTLRFELLDLKMPRCDTFILFASVDLMDGRCGIRLAELSSFFTSTTEIWRVSAPYLCPSKLLLLLVPFPVPTAHLYCHGRLSLIRILILLPPC